MKQPAPLFILVVEDEPEVADAIASALAPLENHFPVEVAHSAEEAASLVEQALADGRTLGLVLCDHVLPGRQGVDFLVDLQKNSATASAKKVLLTGQAGLQPTIQAINEAGLDHYIAKPWQDGQLVETSRRLLTDFVIESGEDLLPFLSSLDPLRLTEEIRRRNAGD
jgi:two-component system chemotaxis response regulator CheY